MVSIPQTAPKINPDRRFFLRRAAEERARHKAADAAAAEILWFGDKNPYTMQHPPCTEAARVFNRF